MCDIAPTCKVGKKDENGEWTGRECDSGDAKYFTEEGKRNYERARHLFHHLYGNGWKIKDLDRVLALVKTILHDHWAFFKEQEKPKIMIPVELMEKALQDPTILLDHIKKEQARLREQELLK